MVELSPGDLLDAGTCGPDLRGDTLLRLHGPDGEEVGRDDDGCLLSLGSRLRYQVPEGAGGTYSLAMDCYGQSDDCGGTLAYRARAMGIPRQAGFDRVRAAARGALGHDGAGGALLADLRIDASLNDWLKLRLEAGPVGVAGSPNGGLVGGSTYLMLLVDLRWMAVGVGAGVTAVGYRGGLLPAQTSAALLALHVRLGSADNFHMEGEVQGAFVGEARTHAVRAAAVLPIGDVDLALRGAMGDDGTVLGEAAAVFWLDPAGSRPRFGLSVHAGVGGVFYQPLCRFNRGCRDTRWVVGPLVGAGFEWRL